MFIIIVLLRRHFERFNTLGLFKVFDVDRQLIVGIRQHSYQGMKHPLPGLPAFSWFFTIIADQSSDVTDIFTQISQVVRRCSVVCCQSSPLHRAFKFFSNSCFHFRMNVDNENKKVLSSFKIETNSCPAEGEVNL